MLRLSTVVLLTVTLAMPIVALAQTGTDTSGDSTVTLPSPIFCEDATCLITQVVRYIFGIIAVIATLMFVWGGVMMITSHGNSDQIKRAKETLVWATIGVLIVLLSWAVVKFVIQGLTG